MGELEYKVRRGNVSLKVTKQEADKYYDMGYSVYTLDGQLVREAVPKDVPTLQQAFMKNQKRIAELEAQVEELKAKLAEVEKPEKPVKTTKKASTKKTME